MRYTLSCTFGQPVRVSCGKFRIVGFSRFCLLCLMFGQFLLGSLSAQGPGGGPPGEGDRGRERGSRGGGFGGRGGFDPAQMISGLDKDGDGVISASEAEQIDRRMRDRMQQNGMDFSKGVRVDELQQSIQRRMEERGPGGPGESDPRRDREGEFQRSDRQENPTPPPQDMGPGFGRDGRGDNRGSTSSGGSSAPTPGKSGSGATSKKGGIRISPLLPDTYKDLDTDYDGQIALYEWRKGKRGTISQFVQNDFDGDGFLIAKELSKAVVAAPTTRTTPVAAPATATVTPVPAAPAASPAPVAVSVNAATEAARAFELLDVDKSGTVLGPEWNKSVRLKPLFEKGGVNLTQPLNLDAFTQAYVRVGAAKK